VNAEDAQAIGARARMIRRRRGLSLDVAAGLAGITKGYLSMLELGQRGFNRRGLIEDLAEALGCSVADLKSSRVHGTRPVVHRGRHRREQD
jgi:transcriptional regulator with XRE-family HTH domain